MTDNLEWGEYIPVDGIEVGFGQFLDEEGGTEALMFRFQVDDMSIPLVILDDNNIRTALDYMADIKSAYADWANRRDSARELKMQEATEALMREVAEIMRDNGETQ